MGAATPFQFALGSIGVHVINDGIFMMDGGAAFGRVPRPLWEHVVAPDHLNRIRTDMNSMLLHSDGKLILIETGYGNKLLPRQMEIFGIERPYGSLIDQLALLDVQPGDIDIVINTHLHGDHAGWNTMLDPTNPSAEPVPTFPNARYIVQQLEWEDATHPNEITEPGYPSTNFLPLQSRGVLDLVEGAVRVTSEIRLVPTPGHTAGHQSVWIESGQHAALFTGDAAIHGVFLERINWISAVDNFPLTSYETKRQIVEETLRRQASLIITHHPFPGLGQLYRPEGQRRAIFQDAVE